MKLSFWGTGAVSAIPVYGCDCLACEEAREEGRERLPASALITVGDKSFLIDAGHPRLDKKLEQYDVSTILLTHYHPDHVQGLFSLRWGHNSRRIHVIGPDDEQGCADLYKNSGILDFSQKTYPFETFDVYGVAVTPIPLTHSKLTCGYLLSHQSKHVAYLCDTKGLNNQAVERLNQQPLDAVILDCTYAPDEPAKNHNGLNDAINIHNQLGQPPMYLTHIGCTFDAWLMAHQHSLPDGVCIAHDGLDIDV